MITAITPGPNNIMLATTSLNFGMRRAIPHMLGICFGFPAMIMVIGLGFGTLFKLYPVAHYIIRLFGIIYLLYLAWKIARTQADLNNSNCSTPVSFWHAVAFQWVNPKALMMCTTALATFTSLEVDYTIQVLIVAGTFLLMSFPTAGFWLIFGAGLQRYLKNPRHLELINPRSA